MKAPRKILMRVNANLRANPKTVKVVKTVLTLWGQWGYLNYFGFLNLFRTRSLEPARFIIRKLYYIINISIYNNSIKHELYRFRYYFI